MQHIPFAPWMRGSQALELVRNADGPKESAAPLTYYSAVLRAHEQLAGEIWSAEAWVGVARSHVMRGDLEAAEAALVQAGMMGTPDPDAAMLMAEILLQTDRAERAQRLLTKLVERRPHLARARYLLGSRVATWTCPTRSWRPIAPLSRWTPTWRRPGTGSATT
ncbi:MAG: tetratricopeptide repeat protein [Gemmatimonadetes bacterium]|nr:tetratricopeptide repeat protein [Gemmatimonadota bacterium]